MNCVKTRFATEKDALFYIEKLNKTSKRAKNPTHAYLCPHCKVWHLTSHDLSPLTIEDKCRERVTNQKNKIKQLELSVERKNEEIKKLKNVLGKLGHRWDIK